MIFAGEARIVKATAAPTVLTVTLRPDEGFEWVVLGGGAITDDANSRNVTITYNDAKYGLTYTTLAMPAVANSMIGIGEIIKYVSSGIYLVTQSLPLIFTHNLYPSAGVSALAAGKSLTLVLQVIERPQNFELLIEELKGYGANKPYRLPIQSRK